MRQKWVNMRKLMHNFIVFTETRFIFHLENSGNSILCIKQAFESLNKKIILVLQKRRKNTILYLFTCQQVFHQVQLFCEKHFQDGLFQHCNIRLLQKYSKNVHIAAINSAAGRGLISVHFHSHVYLFLSHLRPVYDGLE